jgi:hypothetical protein
MFASCAIIARVGLIHHVSQFLYRANNTLHSYLESAESSLVVRVTRRILHRFGSVREAVQANKADSRSGSVRGGH